VAYTEMGLLADAEAEFEVVLRFSPEHAGARAGLEAVRWRRGDPERGPMGDA
jgi:hypothetical protein